MVTDACKLDFSTLPVFLWIALQSSGDTHFVAISGRP
jgi:hypothetical protein